MDSENRFPFHYGAEAEQYAFYRIPKALFDNPVFSEVSTDAKLLYGMMLDRLGLSIRNKWVDENGRAFIYFTMESIKESFQCGNDKALKLLAELDTNKGIGLIKRVRQGLCKPDIIYVKSFIPNEERWTTADAELRTSEKPNSGLRKNRSPDIAKVEPNKTESEKTEINDTEKKYIRHRYGHYQNVLLTDEDLDTLKSEFPTDYQQRIEAVSEYVASTGKRYKNFLATIRNWAKRDAQKQSFSTPKRKAPNYTVNEGGCL